MPRCRAALDEVRQQVGQVPDPEIPAVTLDDLGIVRAVDEVAGRIRVTLTPTYSGCPATEAIREDVRRVLGGLGHDDAEVTITLTPAWTTDWIRPDAHEKLRAYGIAPPVGTSHRDAVQPIHFQRKQPLPTCPQCGSAKVAVLSEFGSTPCKALYRCLSCAEPFDYFKPF